MKARLADQVYAKELRLKGLSFNEILNIIPNLSKGTLSNWLKNIKLTESQQLHLLIKTKTASERGRLKGSLSNHRKRLSITEGIFRRSQTEVLQKINNSLFITGVMLYWAEGDKQIERVGFTNSDPQMISFMMKWFREIGKVEESRFRISLTLMDLHDIEAAKTFWKHTTGLSSTQFSKIRIKPTPLLGKRRPSYMGTCRIVISDKNLFRRIMGWKAGLLEYFDSNAPIAQRIEQVSSNH